LFEGQDLAAVRVDDDDERACGAGGDLLAALVGEGRGPVDVGGESAWTKTQAGLASTFLDGCSPRAALPVVMVTDRSSAVGVPGISALGMSTRPACAIASSAVSTTGVSSIGAAVIPEP
jgi:hypothetical protein